MSQNRPPSDLVEVVCGNRVWGGARSLPSNHVHVGYLIHRDGNDVKISPEFTINDRGFTRIGHEFKFSFNDRPRPVIHALRSVNESDIVEIKYDDPFHRNGVLSLSEIRQFNTSKLWLLGYIVEENTDYIKIALAKFVYTNGVIDYEIPHVIPKAAILNRTNYARAG